MDRSNIINLLQVQSEYIGNALEAHISARHAFQNRMLWSGMMNSFWSFENFLLSSLCLKFRTFTDLKKEISLHSIDSYWNHAVEIHRIPEPVEKRFRPIISKVRNFFNLRYQDNSDKKGRLIYTGQKPKVTDGEGNKVTFDDTIHIHGDEIDHFSAFYLRHLSGYDLGSLGELLASKNGQEVYAFENKYSLYPPVGYQGEKEMT